MLTYVATQHTKTVREEEEEGGRQEERDNHKSRAGRIRSALLEVIKAGPMAKTYSYS